MKTLIAALVVSLAVSARASSECPSNLFAHNDGGLQPYSCVAKCPPGTAPSAPGDFPYSGARACVKSSSAQNCPSNLFSHNENGGLVPYSCVASCPPGKFPSAPGDFPYPGARACV